MKITDAAVVTLTLGDLERIEKSGNGATAPLFLPPALWQPLIAAAKKGLASPGGER